MKSTLVVLMALGLLAPSAYAGSKILPDACGDDSVKFDVKTERSKAGPNALEDGKAQIVFIGITPAFTSPTFRYGVDGTWVGANKGNSYFVIPVTPGEHHLCAASYGSFTLHSYVGMASITAEAGKVYYVEFKVTAHGGGGGGYEGGGPSAGQPVVGGRGNSISAELLVVSEDEGKYRVKISPLSTSTPKK